MKQRFFDEIDSWDDLLSSVYNNSKYFKPEYDIINGKKCISKLYKNEDIDKKINLELDNDLNEIQPINFKGCKNFIGELIIPDSVKYIGSFAFALCSGFTSLKISNNLDTIYDYTFFNCTGFTGELIIPESVEFLSYNSFKNCTGFTSLKLYNNLKRINGSFMGCTGFTGELIIPESVEYIGRCSFEQCNFNKIYVPKIHINKYNIEWNAGCNAKIIEY